jgi:predicted membrane protein
MEVKKQSVFTPQFVLGIIIIALGAGFLLDNFGYFDVIEYIRYWPALLIVYGVAKLIQSPGNPGRIFGGILVAVGALMLLDRMYIITFHIHDWWPVILIIIGVNFLRGSQKRSQNIFERQHGAASQDSSGTADAYLKSFAFMSGVRRSIVSKEFRGGEITAIMGGCELDFREAIIKGDEAVLDVFTMMGGIEMRVPMDWTVVVQAVPIMGGVEDKSYIQQDAKPSKRLIITGNIIMGGVEIKN